MPDFKEIPSSAAGNGGADNAKGTDQKKGSSPTILLPKGGGAIQSIGEKFATNPVTGTGSMSVPIATSPGRSGFGPQLTLSYDSGPGNRVYGFGWTLTLPSITRKTAKGLPQYHNAEESDAFLLSGAEDLVPLLNSDGKSFEDKTSVLGYLIHRYRPCIEGLFARIGRCHRYGQALDVVVVNFINERNAADQRVMELLSEKFDLFEGVFGASNEILRSIESGIDFKKRILEIYDKCRTNQEIQESFNKLQSERIRQYRGGSW